MRTACVGDIGCWHRQHPSRIDPKELPFLRSSKIIRPASRASVTHSSLPGLMHAGRPRGPWRLTNPSCCVRLTFLLPDVTAVAMRCSQPHQVKFCGFVLVAGGLGERLGYGDIKLRLPSETCTMTTYLQLYIGQILHLQER